MSGELAGFALLLVLFVVAVVGHNAGSIRDWFNRPGISLDQWDGVGTPTTFYDQPTQKAPTRRCWSTGPRGSHAYAGADDVWRCMRCGDEVPR